jgi:hypothetical protein
MALVATEPEAVKSPCLLSIVKVCALIGLPQLGFSGVGGFRNGAVVVESIANHTDGLISLEHGRHLRRRLLIVCRLILLGGLDGAPDVSSRLHLRSIECYIDASGIDRHLIARDSRPQGCGLAATQLEDSFLWEIPCDSRHCKEAALCRETGISGELRVVHRAHSGLQRDLEHASLRHAIGRCAPFPVVDIAREHGVGQAFLRRSAPVQLGSFDSALPVDSVRWKRNLHRLASNERNGGHAVGPERQVQITRCDLPSRSVFLACDLQNGLSDNGRVFESFAVGGVLEIHVPTCQQLKCSGRRLRSSDARVTTQLHAFHAFLVCRQVCNAVVGPNRLPEALGLQAALEADGFLAPDHSRSA